MLQQKHNHAISQQGQTLIETLVASFILVMGISAALTLAVFSLSATDKIKQEAIAMGLAREGLEVVKNMRDTNWLKGTISSTCYNFANSSAQAFCYSDWLNAPGGYNIDPRSTTTSTTDESANYTLVFNGTNTLPWSLVKTNSDFGLNANTTIPSTVTTVYYNGGVGVTSANSDSGFSRKITLSTSTFAPFNHTDTGARLKVSSKVWWKGKGCIVVSGEPTNCFVVLETYLTNWRVF